MGLKVEDAPKFLKTLEDITSDLPSRYRICSLALEGTRQSVIVTLYFGLLRVKIFMSSRERVSPQAIHQTYELTIHDEKQRWHSHQRIRLSWVELGDVLEEIEYAIVDGELKNDRQAIYDYLREKMSDFIVEN